MIPFKDVVRTSRPLLWLNTSVLWMLGLLVLNKPPTLPDIAMLLYFTLPFNLWLHGINDVYDYASDRLNARKGSAEGALLAEALHAPMLRAVLWWNFPFLAIAVWQGNWASTLLLALFVFLGWAYSAPPIRAKSRPLIDGLVNVAYILPFLIALAWHNGTVISEFIWSPAVLAFAAWSIASHAFTSIQDIEADRAAGVATVATAFGAEKTVLYALFWYTLAALAAAQIGWQWGALLLLYPLYVLWFRRAPSRERANRLYRLFIVTNSVIGFGITVLIALYNPANTLWAAIVMVGLVGLVAAALVYARYTPQELAVERALEQ